MSNLDYKMGLTPQPRSVYCITCGDPAGHLASEPQSPYLQNEEESHLLTFRGQGWNQAMGGKYLDGGQPENEHILNKDYHCYYCHFSLKIQKNSYSSNI